MPIATSGIERAPRSNVPASVQPIDDLLREPRAQIREPTGLVHAHDAGMRQRGEDACLARSTVTLSPASREITLSSARRGNTR